jgi:hypothetical protein
MRKRLAVVVASAATMLAMFAAPALALQDSGTIGCGSQWVVVRSYANEHVYHFAPSSTQIGDWFNSDPQYRYSYTGVHSTTWKVVSDLTMNYTLTKAYCVPYN